MGELTKKGHRRGGRVDEPSPVQFTVLGYVRDGLGLYGDHIGHPDRPVCAWIGEAPDDHDSTISRATVRRLVRLGLVEVAAEPLPQTGGKYTRVQYVLTDKGRDAVGASAATEGAANVR